MVHNFYSLSFIGVHIHQYKNVYVCANPAFSLTELDAFLHKHAQITFDEAFGASFGRFLNWASITACRFVE